jgi:hypothetical protein
MLPRLSSSGMRRAGGRISSSLLRAGDAGAAQPPAPSTTPIGRHRDLRFPVVKARLKGQVQPAIGRAPVKHALGGNGIPLVAHLDGRDAVALVHGVRHLHHDGHLGAIAGDHRKLEDGEVKALERREQIRIIGAEAPGFGGAPAPP